MNLQHCHFHPIACLPAPNGRVHIPQRPIRQDQNTTSQPRDYPAVPWRGWPPHSTASPSLNSWSRTSWEASPWKWDRLSTTSLWSSEANVQPPATFFVLCTVCEQVEEEVTHRDLDLVPHQPDLHPSGRRQPPHWSGTWSTGSGSIPKQPDPELSGIRLCPFQHHHLGGPPHLHPHQHRLCKVLSHPGPPGPTFSHHIHRRFH